MYMTLGSCTDVFRLVQGDPSRSQRGSWGAPGGLGDLRYLAKKPVGSRVLQV